MHKPSSSSVQVLIASSIPHLLDKVKARLPLECVSLVRLRSCTPTPVQQQTLDKGFVDLLTESEVVLADPGLVCHYVPNHFGGVRWMQSTWAGVDSIFKTLASNKTVHPPIPIQTTCKLLAIPRR